jgi:hypothetical protein
LFATVTPDDECTAIPPTLYVATVRSWMVFAVTVRFGDELA